MERAPAISAIVPRRKPSGKIEAKALTSRGRNLHSWCSTLSSAARFQCSLAPHEPVSAYQHNRTGEDNADAHLKRQVMGREVVVAISAGQLDFRPWEQIFYGEFDGRRRKRVLVKIIGE